MHREWHPELPGDGPAIATSVASDEAAELARLAAGRRVLEIGSAYGYSAVVMALAGGQVTAVDPHTQISASLAVMLANVAAYSLTGRVDIIREYSQTALPALADQGRSFDLVFIDGDHTRDAVRRDAELALKVLAPGGVLAAHDYGEDCCCTGVRQAIDELFPGGGQLTGTLLAVTP